PFPYTTLFRSPPWSAPWGSPPRSSSTTWTSSSTTRTGSSPCTRGRSSPTAHRTRSGATRPCGPRSSARRTPTDAGNHARARADRHLPRVGADPARCLARRPARRGRLPRRPQPGGNGYERTCSIFPEVREFLTRRGLHLSGGQKKMVAISRAMALSPSVLLLDEPFEGLAPVVVTRFIEAVKAIKALGISVLIAESNLVNATRVADRLYAIDRGEIIFRGQPNEVFQNEDVMKTIRG